MELRLGENNEIVLGLILDESFEWLEAEEGKRCTCHQGKKCAWCMMRDGEI